MRKLVTLFFILIPVLCLATLKELPLPKVPAHLKQPKERAAYILQHFWDAMEFTDTNLSHDTAFMEQNLVNFLSLFPHTDYESLPSAVQTLLNRASADRKALDLIVSISERYLHTPKSPMRNEEFYIVFLEELIRLPQLTEIERIRPNEQLKMAKKNRVGSRASNFTYQARNGEKRTLHDTQADPLLLLLYEPDCEHCMEVVNELKNNPSLQALVKEKKLTILAVYAEGDREIWEQSKGTLPTEWMDGIDTEGVFSQGLYALPSLPVIYLLDAKKTVLLKEATPSLIDTYFSR